MRDQVGQNIRQCRKRADLSQEEVALRASLHRTEIGLLERGERLPRADTLVKLSGVLGVTPNDLLDGITWEPGYTSSGQFEVSVEDSKSGVGTTGT
ncbi:MAG TPA: helix-turn-helix transcriptional regulator [Solirubrobacterales bacterium]|nr:helix-turn-helix transcriptional regulator [Solirubrobacterales bacterium]